MPNGKEGDHPLSDMTIHGRHPFPIQIEDLLRQILDLDPGYFNARDPREEQFSYEKLDQWRDRICVEEGVAQLTAELHELRGGPHA